MSYLVGARLFVRHRRITAATLSIVTLCAAGASMWPVTAQNQAVRAPNAVERLATNAPAPRANAFDRGATFRWLEERTTRVTTTFADAIATTERIAGGDLRTTLSDAAGRELGALDVDRVAAGSDVLTFKKDGQQVVRAAGRAGSQPSLDWSNRQAYAMWKDKADDPSIALEWQGDLIRARGGAALDFHRDTLSLKTEWGEEFVALASRSAGQRPHPTTGAPSRGTTFESRLVRDNIELGRSRWYPEEQVYVWSVPGLTKGYLDADRMKDVGGWTFTPDLAWTNVQTYAFHYFHTLIATQGFVAEAKPAPRPWLARLVDAFAPTVYANEPGCDGFHWLDYTIFRPCCDLHDRCYEKYGCSWRSWWQWWSSWRCDACNIGVTFCIIALYPPYSPSYP
jgi:hypothetical protein